MRHWIMLSLAAVLLTGCWDRKEINDVTFVSISAVDLDKDMTLKIASQFISPIEVGSKDSTEEKSKLEEIKAEGKTVSELVGKLQSQLSRRFNTSHRQVLIFSQKVAAERGLQDLFDAIMRSNQTRLQTRIILSEGSAIDLLKVKSQERTSAEAFREAPIMSNVIDTSLKNLFIAESLPGIDFTLPVFKKQASFASLRNLGVFRSLKLRGILTEEETDGYHLLKGKAKERKIQIQIRGKSIFMQVVNSSAKIKVEPNMKITCFIRVSASITENTTSISTTSKENLQFLNSMLASKIEEEANMTIKRLQSLGSDPLGIGLETYRSYPRLFGDDKKWYEEYPNLNIHVAVKSKITGTGILEKRMDTGDQ